MRPFCTYGYYEKVSSCKDLALTDLVDSNSLSEENTCAISKSQYRFVADGHIQFTLFL